MNKDYGYYLTLPYQVVLNPAIEGGYVAEIPELPGCLSQGENAEEALAMILDAQKSWIKTALAKGMEIPEPRGVEAYSGKFNIRMPKSLHRALSEKAREENISLNQLIIYQLSRGLGR